MRIRRQPSAGQSIRQGTASICVAALGTAAILGGVVTISSQLLGLAPVQAGPAAAVFVPVQPCRLADTRPDPDKNFGFTRIDSLTVSVPTTGLCGIPAGATSLALTLTAVSPIGPGFLTAWPANQTRPQVSNINFRGGQIRANGSITQVDPSGKLRVYTSVLSYVLVDVVGAFVPSGATNTGRFVPISSTRLYDSRPNHFIAPGHSVTMPLPAGVPSDAIALSMNVTVTETQFPGFATTYAAGTAQPNASMLNLDASHQTRAAGGIFPVSAAGVTIFLSGGGHVVVDFSGYFTGPSAQASTTGLFTVANPDRLMDTRLASPLGVGVPIYPGGGVELPASQTGSMAYNATSVDGDAGFIRGFPAGTSQPATSTLNPLGAGDVVANFAITQASNRGFGYWSQPQTHLLVDVQGWFSGPSVTATLPPLTNEPPPPVYPIYSACIHDGFARINAARIADGKQPLIHNANAEEFACYWALQLAQLGGTLVHSNDIFRNAFIGCGSGENIGWNTGTDTSVVIDRWFDSPPHLANMLYAPYIGMGTGFVVRTNADGTKRTFGVTEFALC